MYHLEDLSEVPCVYLKASRSFEDQGTSNLITTMTYKDLYRKLPPPQKKTQFGIWFLLCVCVCVYKNNLLPTYLLNCFPGNFWNLYYHTSQLLGLNVFGKKQCISGEYLNRQLVLLQIQKSCQRFASELILMHTISDFYEILFMFSLSHCFTLNFITLKLVYIAFITAQVT